MSRARSVRPLRMLLCAVLLLASAAGPAAGAGSGAEPVVDTDLGQVRGRAHGTYLTFDGIPFAAPPTGPLRWRLPQPAARWEGVRDAGSPGSRCLQRPSLGPGGLSGSEDCLYLNVTAPSAPAPAGRPRPVMVWIHGGGFTSGAGDLYRPESLAVRGDTVVVTVNYRLGIFGLFGHPGLGGAPNFAIADQQAALRWVRANIRGFGGDPYDVTLFGESAGGLSVCAHLASPASGGLFRRAVSQSGPCSLDSPPGSVLPGQARYQPFVPERTTVAQGTATAAALGCERPDPGAAVECLRGVDAAALATPDLMQRFSLVSYGNGALPLEPRRALETGRFHRVPVILGTNRDEMRLFLAAVLRAFPIPDEAAYRSRLELSFGAAAAQAVAARYPVGAYATPALAWAAVMTDVSFVCPGLRDGRRLARYVPTYAYRFGDRDAPNFTGLPAVEGFPFGAAHGFELPYLFDYGVALTGPQRELSNRMTGYWAAFAHAGTPAAPAAPQWPRFGHSPSVLSLAPGPGGITTLDAEAEHGCAFWNGTWPPP
ncbi:carboxylesterase family protein [Streptomyces sp. NPDC032472]|uniref:carboxylesterase/lipase family protein n=1 Tax=Streptomyces sp. NPDC032472 TaxID=3155018 RepID=UPI0033FFFEFE